MDCVRTLLGLMVAFADGLRAYGHGGRIYSIAFLCPGMPAAGAGDAKRAALAQGVKVALCKPGLHYQVADSGVGIDVTAAAVHKGTGLQHFSTHIGQPVQHIAKFGDRGSEHGNDRLLLQPPHAYCVGPLAAGDTCADGVVQMDQPGPAGVMLGLAELSPALALACDFDGTLAIYPEPMPEALQNAILARLQARVPVAIISGRPAADLCRAAVEPLHQLLVRRGLNPTLLDSLVCYAYNGAYAQSGTALRTEMARLEAAPQQQAVTLASVHPLAGLSCSAANTFGVRLIDASVASPAAVVALADWIDAFGHNKYALLLPGEAAMPTGFRLICRGGDLAIKTLDRQQQPIAAEQVQAARAMQVWPPSAQLVVPQTSAVPAVLHGRKAAGHVTLTVQTKVSACLKKALLARQGTPLPQKAFVDLVHQAPQEVAAAQEMVDLMICGKTSHKATIEAYANTYADFGGSADVTAEGCLEGSAALLRRELGEEAGAAAVELLGRIDMQHKLQETAVDLGGLFYVRVQDSYTKAVSHKTMALAEFAAILARTAADGEELTALAIVCMPPPEALTAPGTDAKAAAQILTDHLKAGWCALPASLHQADAKAQEAASRSQTGVVRMLVKVLTARGYFGRPWDSVAAPQPV